MQSLHKGENGNKNKNSTEGKNNTYLSIKNDTLITNRYLLGDDLKW